MPCYPAVLWPRLSACRGTKSSPGFALPPAVSLRAFVSRCPFVIGSRPRRSRAQCGVRSDRPSGFRLFDSVLAPLKHAETVLIDFSDRNCLHNVRLASPGKGVNRHQGHGPPASLPSDCPLPVHYPSTTRSEFASALLSFPALCIKLLSSISVAVLRAIGRRNASRWGAK